MRVIENQGFYSQQTHRASIVFAKNYKRGKSWKVRLNDKCACSEYFCMVPRNYYCPPAEHSSMTQRQAEQHFSRFKLSIAP
jgi:hypothetical protein